jgi:hypothetical protein
MQRDVPKPSVPSQTRNVVIIAEKSGPEYAPQPDGLGTPDEPMEHASKQAQEVGVDIVVRFGSLLSRSDRIKLVTIFRRVLIPPKRRGRRPKEAITSAHRDWRNGIRGLTLYRAHIPGFEKHSQWRRSFEQRALMDAIYSREKRERTRNQSSARR